ncbi:MAG TPA: MarR family transcriptional regulator [Gemmatimonadaceae bacterium]|nr:MarR family transcriptional regulator [Gemmatimonadaceae bacterium]
MTTSRTRSAPRITARDFHQLAQFRYQLRRFLRFSERAARGAGVTPLQHQLLLGVAGFTGRGSATISELSECLQERHNAVVALVHRAEAGGLVRKARSAADRRVVDVVLTPRGRGVLLRLTRLHRQELAAFPHTAWPVPSPARRAEAGR